MTIHSFFPIWHGESEFVLSKIAEKNTLQISADKMKVMTVIVANIIVLFVSICSVCLNYINHLGLAVSKILTAHIHDFQGKSCKEHKLQLVQFVS